MLLLCGGIVGTAFGVWMFNWLRAVGQLDLTIGVSYVLLLGMVGTLMVVESVRAISRARHGRPTELRRPGSHAWFHGLPLKFRFKRSKIYVSIIPVLGIGFIVEFISTFIGIGGGFLLVPVLIYILRVPTSVVIGTSMVLTLVTMAGAIVMHAATNHQVDAVLALILMVGGVIGAQFGARAGQKTRGERLRLVLGLLVLAVGIRFAFNLVLEPEDLYAVRPLEDGPMRPPRHHRCSSLPRSRGAAAPRRGAAADRLALHPPRDGDLELHRRRARAVRRDRGRAPRARPATTSSPPSSARARTR